MFKKIKTTYYATGVAFTMGMLSSSSAFANNFNDITGNIQDSIAEVPGMITGISYLVGTLLAALGVLKLKDHVENPTQTPLREGAIRLLAGGALFALPILVEAMQTTVGTGSPIVGQALKKVKFEAQ